MDSTFELYDCPPFRARMTLQHCAANRARAAAPRTRRRLHKALDDDARPGRKECVDCPGVLYWAKQSGRGPHTRNPSEIARGLVAKEEQRRRLAGVPLEVGSRRGGEYADELAGMLRRDGRL